MDAKPPSARALAVGCGSCHGQDGRGQGGIPGIGGKPEAEFLRHMQEFRAGKYGATAMHRIARGYSDEELALLAQYFARH
jgi:cytochrome c553